MKKYERKMQKYFMIKRTVTYYKFIIKMVLINSFSFVNKEVRLYIKKVQMNPSNILLAYSTNCIYNVSHYINQQRIDKKCYE